MAKVFILGRKLSVNGDDKMIISGVFTQKKTLWEELGKICELDSFQISDDVGGRTADITYAILCEKLRVVGRASILKNGIREFQVTGAELNEIRPSDFDENGKPKCNPIL